jgi:hypothetical protein
MEEIFIRPCRDLSVLKSHRHFVPGYFQTRLSALMRGEYAIVSKLGPSLGPDIQTSHLQSSEALHGARHQ